MRSLTCVLLLLLSSSLAARAGALQFANDLGQTLWSLKHDRFTCRLVQVIPEYGRAELVQRADGKLSFFVRALPDLYNGQLTRVVLAPAPWQPVVARTVLTLHAGQAGRPVDFGNETARTVMLGFRAGRFVDFSYPADRAPRVQVRVSSLGFQAALDKLQKCVVALPPARFADFATTTVHFASDVYRLDNSARARIERLIGYLKVYHVARLIVVAGYTDYVGSMAANYLLGEHRARSVVSLLRSQGITLPITVHSYGESHPVASNLTAVGRARNRRVTITLKR